MENVNVFLVLNVSQRKDQKCYTLLMEKMDHLQYCFFLHKLKTGKLI